jgi:hypothetical protein
MAKRNSRVVRIEVDVPKAWVAVLVAQDPRLGCATTAEGDQILVSFPPEGSVVAVVDDLGYVAVVVVVAHATRSRSASSSARATSAP